MSESVLVSRDSRRPPPTPQSVAPPSSSRRARQPPTALPISCNRCRKPLNTTVFVCACDCVFCEECTYSHFNESSNCPTCNRVLSENDFMEILVADPSPSTATKTASFQTLFTKQNATGRALAFQDLCSRYFKHADDHRSAGKFIMKQLIVEVSKQGHRANQALRSLANVNQEFTSHKQSANAQRMRLEKALENLQQQLALAQKKIDEKDHQIAQFRKIHDQMTPASPHDGPRRVSGEGARPPMQSQPHQHQQQRRHDSATPPMKGFMIQKEAHERAKQHALEAPHQRTPLLGATSRGYAGGGHGTTPDRHHESIGEHQQRSYSSESVGSGGIRHLGSSSGHSYGSGGKKRRRGMSPGGAASYGRAMSPSQAFAMQPAGAYSNTRGPGNYFQQQRQGYPGRR